MGWFNIARLHGLSSSQETCGKWDIKGSVNDKTCVKRLHGRAKIFNAISSDVPLRVLGLKSSLDSWIDLLVINIIIHNSGALTRTGLSVDSSWLIPQTSARPSASPTTTRL